ncbi:MAG: alpha/beta hydrolase [Armatimonadota bacterium]|nr:alpha/beta hydrolase [Armatimonadota bacterium]
MTALVDGQGLLFLHGAGGSRLVWQHQVLAFPRAQAADLPGRAGDPPEGVDGYLEALRASLGVARHGRGGVVAGHSLGGAMALRWALRYPEEVFALILVGTGARLRVTPALLEGIRNGRAEAVEAFGAMWFAPQAPARLEEKALALLRSVPLATLLADLEAADRFDVMEEVGRIRQPTLVLCGSDDRLTPVRYSRYLHEQIPGSELVIVEGAGHIVMLEQPKATNAAIRTFLRRLDREARR